MLTGLIKIWQFMDVFEHSFDNKFVWLEKIQINDIIYLVHPYCISSHAYAFDQNWTTMPLALTIQLSSYTLFEFIWIYLLMRCMVCVIILIELLKAIVLLVFFILLTISDTHSPIFNSRWKCCTLNGHKQNSVNKHQPTERINEICQLRKALRQLICTE